MNPFHGAASCLTPFLIAVGVSALKPIIGFRVKELMGGPDWWKRDGYPTSGKQGSQGNSEILCGC